MIIVISGSLSDDLGAIWEAGGTIWASISELGLVLGIGWNFMISQGAHRVQGTIQIEGKVSVGVRTSKQHPGHKAREGDNHIAI